MDESRKKIGLALGGGSARGCSHVGVIKALEEAGIRIDMVAGTSIGSLIGGVYASGNLEVFDAVVEKISWKQVLQYLDLAVPSHGLLKGKKIMSLINSFLGTKQIEDLNIPYAAVAADVETGEEIVFDNGDLVKAIRASISLPAVFNPVEQDGRYLVDGGLVNPLPVSVLRNMGAEVVIAVDLNHHFSDRGELDRNKFKDRVKAWTRKKGPLIFDILGWSINVMQDQITQKNLAEYPADILIQPNLGEFRAVDLHRAGEMIELGYSEASKMVDKVKNLIQ